MLQEACTCLSRALSNILSRQRLEADLRHTRIAESRAKILLRFAKAVTVRGGCLMQCHLPEPMLLGG